MNKYTLTLLAFSILLAVTTCNDSEKNNLSQNYNPDTKGIGFANTSQTPVTTYNNIIAALNANNDIGIVAQVNHTSNAQNTDLTLPFTRTVYFGNPALGTPLMQENIAAGLDLPQRISVYTTDDGNTILSYNSVNYLINRHQVQNAATTDMIASALSNLVNNASSSTVTLNTDSTQTNEGIVSVLSENDFNTTYNLIISNLNDLESITIIAELDHQMNAQSVDMTLNPTKLIIFGNPELGTPLMQSSRTTALDLPQKMLIYENSNGDVNILYNDPNYLANRHGIDIDANENTLATISTALENISTAGATMN